MFKPIHLFVSLLFFYCGAVYGDAQRSIYQLTLTELFEIEVVSAASGFEQKVSDAPATVTVINKEQWQSMGATSLSDVLSTVAGVHVSQPKFYSYYGTSFTIRGLTGLASSKIKLLIDGLPLENMQVSGLSWGFHMPLTGFSRIEVIKSPGSAIYGADAYAGIINLVSESYEKLTNSEQLETSGDFGMRIGSFDDVDIFTTTQGQYREHQWMFGIDYTRSDGDPDKMVEQDLQSIFDSLFDTNASLAPGPLDQSHEVFKMIGKWQYKNWSADYLTWRNLDVGIGTGGGQTLVNEGRLHYMSERYSVNYRLDDWLGGQLDWQYSYMTQGFDAKNDTFPNGAKLPIDADGNISLGDFVGFTVFEDGFIGDIHTHGRTNSVSVTHLTQYDDSNYIRFQLGYEKQHFHVDEAKNFGPGVLDGTQAQVDGSLIDVTNTPFVFIEPQERHFMYASYHQNWQLHDDVIVSVGIRYDRYSDFGSTTNPRLSLIWQVNDKLSLKAFTGSAFKAPSISQLYAQNNPAIHGNPEVKEERINTLELGNSIRYELNENLILGLSLFRYRAKDLIAYAPSANSSASIAQNLGEQKGVGGEFTVKSKITENISIDGHYSYLRAQSGDGDNIADVPTQMAYLGVNWRVDSRLSLSMYSKWINERLRPSGDNRDTLPSYNLTTISIQYQDVFAGFDGSLVVNNLFDAHGKDPSESPIPNDFAINGRHLMLGLSRDF